MSDIERVTLENAADQLKAKIRTAFVELLPEEQWKEMVAAELKRFTVSGSERDWQGNHKRTPSGFETLCREVFTEHVKAELKKMLASTEWTGAWVDGRQQLSEAVKSWCTENSKALIEATVLAMAGQAAQQMVQHMRNM